MATQVESIKWVPGTRFLVDGFRFADPPNQPGARYFLTHFHGDHYTGLRRAFPGTIYASDVTAELLVHDYRLKVGAPDGAEIVRLPLNVRVEVDGAHVTALPANHCPGAVMLLFEVPRAGGGPPHVILHTGDCRWAGRRGGGRKAAKGPRASTAGWGGGNRRGRLPPKR